MTIELVYSIVSDSKTSWNRALLDMNLFIDASGMNENGKYKKGDSWSDYYCGCTRFFLVSQLQSDREMIFRV